MAYEDEIDQDIDEDGKFQEDEFSTEDITRESISRLLIELGEPLPVKRITVDYWATSLHGAKLGIKKDAQWQSKSRQFNPEMKIVGEVEYVFDENKLVRSHALKYWEVTRAEELGQPLSEIKADPALYEKLVLKPFEKVPLNQLRELLASNNETLPEIPPEEDRKLVIAINERYWDTSKPDKSRMEEIDVDKDGKVDKKQYAENYLRRKFGLFADLNKRIIIKLFRKMSHTRKEMQGVWMGTLEQSLFQSMALTFGEKAGKFHGTITLPGFDYQTPLFRVFTFIGQRFVMPIIDKRLDLSELFENSIIKGKDLSPSSSDKLPTNYYVRYYLIEEHLFTFGSDYRIFDPQDGNRLVAEIDGRFIDVGGKWDIKILDDDLARDALFRSNLVLFTCLIKYQKECNTVLTRLYKEMRKKVKQFTDDELREMISMYLIELEKKRGETFPDRNEKIEFALKILRTKQYSDKEIMSLLNMKYDLNLTPHELSMLFNPRRVRS